MATPNMLKSIAGELGVTVEEMVTDAMRKYKNPFRAALVIGVYPNTIRNYIVTHGWTFQSGEWVEPEKELTA